mmetsp:Transcript_12225/g.22603  ORF Transcript_12225/g.22603 Transcript_12225/m.22603 type:complete len:475 (-) Transcript_12225:44-1468(-)
MGILGGLLPFRRNRRNEPRRLPTVFDQMRIELKEDLEVQKKHMASQPRFNIVITILILAHAIVIATEVDWGGGSKMEDRVGFFLTDLFFSAVFLGEMLIRQAQLGWDYFVDAWNVFDYVLVVFTCAGLVKSLEDDNSYMQLVGGLRIVRYIRIVRSIRGPRIFRELYMIMQGLLHALATLAWVMLLLFIVVYCFGVMLTTFVGQSERAHEHLRYWEQYAGTVWRSMWTTIQIVTFDQWASDIARPMNEVSPGIFLLIIGVIAICTFGILNVMVSVMVQQVLSIAKENNDKVDSVLEKNDRMILRSMVDDFKDCDGGAKDELDIVEFRRLLQTQSFAYKLRLLGVQIDEAEHLFELMDADDSGTLSPEEFINGLQKLKGNAKGQDLVQLICFAQKQSLRAKRYVERVQKLNQKADVIQARLNDMSKDLVSELTQRQHATVRSDKVWQHAAERQQVITQLDAERRLKFPSLEETGL